LTKDTLINFENNGTRISDSLSRQYVLFKRIRRRTIQRGSKRRRKASTLSESASDPFWSVEIDNEKFILFKLAAAAKP